VDQGIFVVLTGKSKKCYSIGYSAHSTIVGRCIVLVPVRYFSYLVLPSAGTRRWEEDVLPLANSLWRAAGNACRRRRNQPGKDRSPPARPPDRNF
jgi:hypothetical protein